MLLSAPLLVPVCVWVGGGSAGGGGRASARAGRIEDVVAVRVGLAVRALPLTLLSRLTAAVLAPSPWRRCKCAIRAGEDPGLGTRERGVGEGRGKESLRQKRWLDINYPRRTGALFSGLLLLVEESVLCNPILSTFTRK